MYRSDSWTDRVAIKYSNLLFILGIPLGPELGVLDAYTIECGFSPLFRTVYTNSNTWNSHPLIKPHRHTRVRLVYPGNFTLLKGPTPVSLYTDTFVGVLHTILLVYYGQRPRLYTPDTSSRSLSGDLRFSQRSDYWFRLFFYVRSQRRKHNNLSKVVTMLYIKISFGAVNNTP